ncbi:MAG: leucine-rich repeat protein [Clostridia bacterium]|nr:leucine-rich repeat protein [Clostridia bacterium]
MKKSTKKLIVIFCACGFLVAAGVFAALWSTRLSPPKNLAVSDTGILTWDGCKNASLYVVNIDGEEYEATDTQLDIFFITDGYKDYNITVTAKHRLFKGRTRRSDWFVYSLPAPPDDFFQFIKADDGTDTYSVGVNLNYTTELSQRDLMPAKIIFPEAFYNGKPVVQASLVGRNKETVTSIILPEGISSISLKDCKSLRRLHIPETVTALGKESFYNCYKLEEVTLPKGIKEIGEMAFMNCFNLKSINLPEGLLKIDVDAFYGCESLRQVKIPASVEVVACGAFRMCDNLSIILPSSVKEVQAQALFGTVYTDAREIPAGWKMMGDSELDWPPNATIGMGFITGKLFLNCKLNYEGEDVYVEALTYTEVPQLHQWMPYNSEPVRHGYTFKGWATERDGTVVYTMEQLLSYTGDGWPDDLKADKTPVVPYGTTLYPVWESA